MHTHSPPKKWRVSIEMHQVPTPQVTRYHLDRPLAGPDPTKDAFEVITTHAAPVVDLAIEALSSCDTSLVTCYKDGRPLAMQSHPHQEICSLVTVVYPEQAQLTKTP